MSGEPPTVRCAIYTRKSTTDGLEQEFNTLDAQREAGEAYIASQKHDGWVALPERYDDGGYTGGNTDRPALRRLLADIDAGKVDCVVVYKVDRLSRSLRDFLQMMEIFLKLGVMFVSVTQAFCTATAIGRLMLNMLLSFAEYEREMISERTRDKMSAARRKGMWVGGRPVLGYDAVANKLVINPAEADQVREIFRLYLKLRGLIPLVQELEHRGWTNKVWGERGGKPFSKSCVHRLLTNVTYVGKVLYKKEVFNGQHEAIMDAETWQAAQALLAKNGRSGGASVRNRFGALLKGLLRCTACKCQMTPTHSTKGQVRYRYYRCTNSQQHGNRACPCPSIPAHEIERVVVDQIRQIGRDPQLVQETLLEIERQSTAAITPLESEQRRLTRELARFTSDLRQVAAGPAIDLESPAAACLADLQERIARTEQRLLAIQSEIDGLTVRSPDQPAAVQALADFDPVWEALTPREQVQLVELLVQQVDFDGVSGKISITFHATGLTSLAHSREDHAA